MGKLSHYDIRLNTLPAGEHTFDFHLGKEFFEMMENNDVRNANLDVKLTVTYRHDVYSLAFEVTGTVTVACDRCLDDLDLPIEATYNIKVKLSDRYADDSDDIIEIPQNEALNVAYMIYDTVVLAIPVKHVHPLGKCNRQMSALLKKHRATRADDEDAELEDALIDEMESMPDDVDTDL